MSMEYKLGFIVGLVIALVVGGLFVYFALKYTKKDKSVKCQYDERQQQARGNGFKIGFYTHLIYSAILGICSIMEIDIPVESGMKEFFGIILSVIVFAMYCIRKQAYISLNENAKKLTVVFVIIGIINLAGGVMRIVEGTIIKNGVLTVNALNLFVGICMLFTAIVIYLSKDTEE